MLIEFTVGNFKSFKEKATFSMVAANLTAPDHEVDVNNVFASAGNVRLLTSAAIYGANASGKSNLVAALRFMRQFVLSSSREGQAEDSIPVESFRLSEETRVEPSFFQIVFLIGDRKYRYGFEVDATQVVSEWLFHVPSTKEATLFTRTIEDGIQSKFKEGKGLESKTRKEALFISVVSQFNGETARAILRWFRLFNIVSGLQDDLYLGYTLDCLEENHNKEEIVEFVKQLDLGIENIQVSESAALVEYIFPKDVPEEIRTRLLRSRKHEQKEVRTVHPIFNKRGEVVSQETFLMNEHESEGTKKLFALAGPLMDTLKTGKVVFIDELDARLHPLITSAIIGLFNSPKINPCHAQLIFTTHDTNLLSNRIFRRDQIWFTEKDKQGASHLYSLAEFRVRKTASFEKDYIQGEYGAIPFLGGLRRFAECLGTDDAR